MKRTTIGVVLVFILALGAITPGQQPAQQRRDFLSALKVGQSVSLKEAGGRFVLSVIDDGPALSHKVIEIGSDFVLLEDMVGVSEIRVPLYAITSFSRLKSVEK